MLKLGAEYYVSVTTYSLIDTSNAKSEILDTVVITWNLITSKISTVWDWYVARLNYQVFISRINVGHTVESIQGTRLKLLAVYFVIIARILTMCVRACASFG